MDNQADHYAAICNLLAHYCVLLDQDDVDAWVDLFTTDATYTVYGHTFRGHDGLRKMMSGAPGGLHLGGPPAVTFVDDDRALAQQNLLFYERTGNEMRRALYDDELVRTADGWRIASRRCRFITVDGLSDRP
jgi:3-phenylpropionate/cinnamic acid dioxygenase small subunit